MVVNSGSWVYPFSHWTNGGSVLFKAGNLTVEPNGGFNAAAKGYRGTFGPGSKGAVSTVYDSGASHGGRGGAYPASGNSSWPAATYGSVTQPVRPGSGGTSYPNHDSDAGSGGGVIRLDIAGTATIRGTLNATGGKSFDVYGGGGSGGSVYLKCNTFGGTTNGLITADGGSAIDNNSSGAGGGGRIAVDYQNVGTPAAVRFSAGPGSTEWANNGTEDRWPYRARWGTLWLPNAALFSGILKGQQFRQVHVFGVSTWGVSSLTVSNCSLTFAQNQCVITITNNLRVTTAGAFGIGSYSLGTNYRLRCGGDMILTNGGSFHLYSGMTNSAVTNYGAYLAVTNTLAIAPGSWLYTYAHESNGGTPKITAGSAAIAAGAGIMADTRGYAAAQGPGTRPTWGTYNGGGGYGGRGGSGADPLVGGLAYGSADLPINPGSGGSGHNAHQLGAGPGGGAIRLEVANTLTIRGTLSANGGSSYSPYGGGGSGGGIYLKCQTLDATGAVARANGANSAGVANGGSGGGGRIAVDYQTLGANKDIRFSTSPGTIGWAYTDRDNRWRHMPGIGSLSLPDAALLRNPLTDRIVDDACLYFTRTGRWGIASLTVTNCTVSFAESGFRVHVTNNLVIGANGEFGMGGDPTGTGYVLSCAGSIRLTNNGIMTVYSGLTNAGTASWGALVAATNSFIVSPGSWVYPVSHESNGGSPLFRASNVYVRANSGFSANTKGYGPRLGPGKAPDAGGPGGGGHGGKGGDGLGGAGGAKCGITNGPVTPGSGGGSYPAADRYGKNGAGGGTVRVEASGIIQVDGTIRANGEKGIFDTWGSGGAGGAIYLACNSFYGGTNAAMQVNGGNSFDPSSSSYAGAGGGGRIAVWMGVAATNRANSLAGMTVSNLSASTFFPNYDGTISWTNGLGRTTSPAAPGTRRFMRMEAPNSAYLDVRGIPNKLNGSPQPLGYGTHFNIAKSTILTNRAASPADQAGGLRHACTGWKLKNDIGTLITNNSSTQAVFSLATNMVLTWYWTNQYLLTVTSLSNGSVNSGMVNGWYTNNRVVTGIQASPSNGYAFSVWTGDVPAPNAAENPLSLTMSQARSVQAHFVEAISLTKVWNGNGTWTNAGNWNPAGAPSTLDHAIIQSGTCVLRQSAYIKSLIVSNSAILVFTNWATKLYVADDVTVRSNGLITLPSSFTEAQMSNHVHFSCSNLTVQKTARIDVDSKGYGPWNGPGKATSSNYGNGGGYGGQGGREFPQDVVPVGQTYGSASAPLSPGSGGGSHNSGDWPKYAGSGGGAVRVEATGTVTVHGTISANGGPATYGQHAAGGSGGAIYITCKTFGGSTNGIFRVNGGNGWENNLSGGGGGGRIAVAYQSLLAEHNVRFSASPATVEYASADMTNRWVHAARMGTLWLPDKQLLALPLSRWRFKDVNLTISNMTSWAVSSLTVTNNSLLFVENGFQLRVTNDITIGSGGSLYLGAYNESGTGYALYCGGNLVLTNGGRLYIYAGNTNGATTNGALLAVTNTLTIGPSSWLYLRCSQTNGGAPFVKAAQLSVATSGGINAVGGGYRYMAGPGVGRSAGTYNGAGGYGGDGGGGCDPLLGGAPYGSVSAPSAPGSGGASHTSHTYAGGWGGGLVRILVTGSAVINGTVTADGIPGQDWYGSAGSGGGVYIVCQTFGGTGLLSARGGNAFDSNGAGGGGGRIALNYQSLSSPRGMRFSAAPGTVSWYYGVPDHRWLFRPQAGTVWLPDVGLLTNQLTGGRFNGLRLYLPGTVEWNVSSLNVSNCSLTFADSGFRLTVTNNIVINNGTLGIGDDATGTGYVLTCLGNMVITNGGSLYAYAGVTNASSPGYGTLVDVGGQMTVANNCWVYPVSHKTNGAAVLFRAANLWIGTNAGFNASGKGYMSRFGPGHGSTAGDTYASGAGYGGRGGMASPAVVGGITYGSSNAPVHTGSGGGTYPEAYAWYLRGGNGGGVVRIEASGSVTLKGSLSANGCNTCQANHVGAGSGGSIFLQCGTRFDATAGALLSAEGGDAIGLGGGGGGGRIAVWVKVTAGDKTRLFAGQQPLQASASNSFSAYPLLSVVVTNGTGFVSASPATMGTTRLIVGNPNIGAVFMLR